MKSSHGSKSPSTTPANLLRRTTVDTARMLTSPREGLSAEERASIDVDALLRAGPDKDEGWVLEAAEKFYRLGADVDAFAFAQDVFRASPQLDSDTWKHLFCILAISAVRMHCGEVYLKMLEGLPEEKSSSETDAKKTTTHSAQEKGSSDSKHWMCAFVEKLLEKQRGEQILTIGHYALFKRTRPEREPDYVRAVLQNYREHRKTLTLARTIEDSLDAVDVVPCPEKGGFKMIATRPIAKDECFFEETSFVNVQLSSTAPSSADEAIAVDDKGKDTGWLRFSYANEKLRFPMAESIVLGLKVSVLMGRRMLPPQLVLILRSSRDGTTELHEDEPPSSFPGLRCVQPFFGSVLQVLYDFQRECPSLAKLFGTRDFFDVMFIVSEVAHYCSVTQTSALFAIGSFMNDSEDPNAKKMSGRPDKLKFQALRDIAAGEEITIKYHGDRSP